MAYRLKAADSSVEAAVRRIAGEQVEKALDAIASKSAAKAVHEVRKTCKKVRALIRMVRTAFPDYAKENARFRDIARNLSGARDAKVLGDTFDVLAADAKSTEPLASLREHLASTAAGAAAAGSEEQAITHARQELEVARAAIEGWNVDGGWSPVGKGLTKILLKAQKAALAVHKRPRADRYHELRKLMKHHWYHTRLLEPLWPEMMRARAAELSGLADLLGLHHDICVFSEWLTTATADHAAKPAVDIMTALADARRQTLEGEIAPITARLLAQSPQAVEDHWHALWTIWRD